MQLIPQIWAETILVSMYRSLAHRNETLEETQQRVHRQYEEHMRHMAEDPEYARKHEEGMRELNKWLAESECECE